MSTTSEPLDAEEAFHNGFYYFLRAAETLSLDADSQCKEMGDSNVAWELKDDVMAGRYLLGAGFLPRAQEQSIEALLQALKPVPVNDMPTGDGRAPNLAAMSHPAWGPLRILAKNSCEQLAAFAKINRTYFERGANTT